jgi:hypothetical protein
MRTCGSSLPEEDLMMPQQPLRRLATVQKVYAWGTFALGALPLAALLCSRVLYKDDPDYAPTLARLLEDLIVAAAVSIYSMILIACALSSAATALSARFVSRGSHPLFCRAVAVLNLLYFPFGTALGVVTLRTLARHQPDAPAGC